MTLGCPNDQTAGLPIALECSLHALTPATATDRDSCTPTDFRSPCSLDPKTARTALYEFISHHVCIYLYIYGSCPKLLFPQRPLGPSLRQPCAFLARPHSRITFIISVAFHHYSRTCFWMLNIQYALSISYWEVVCASFVVHSSTGK